MKLPRSIAVWLLLSAIPGCVALRPVPARASDALTTVYFAPRSTTLSAEGREALAAIAELLQRSPEARIELVVYALELSSARARGEAVKRFLVSRGLANGRIAVHPHVVSPGFVPSSRSVPDVLGEVSAARAETGVPRELRRVDVLVHGGLSAGGREVDRENEAEEDAAEGDDWSPDPHGRAAGADASPDEIPTRELPELLGVDVLLEAVALPAPPPAPSMAAPTRVARAPGDEEFHLYWNGWAVNPGRLDVLGLGGSADAKAVLRLEPERDYRIWLDLSDVEYRTFEEGYESGEAADGETGLARILCQALEAGERQVELTLLLLPDTHFFALETERAVNAEVDLERVKQLCESADAAGAPSDLAEAMERRLLRASFKISTRDRVGYGAIALAVWSEIGPLDEFVFGFCIGEPGGPECSQPSAMSNGLAGVDSRRSRYGSSRPDAALHFIELRRGDRRYLAGLFWDATRPGVYRYWELDESVAGLQEWLAETFQADLAAAIKWPQRRLIRNAGTDLYLKLFPGGRRTAAAREAFGRFARAASARSGDGPEAPSLFVRVIGLDQRQPVWLPMGFLLPPDDPEADPGSAGAASGPRPLGFTTRVEMPLLSQSYYTGTECLSRWTLVTPPAGLRDADLKAARNAMGDFHRWRGEGVVRLRKMAYFDALLRAPGPMDASGIAVTSHYDRRHLYFVPMDPLSPGATSRARFRKPSVLLLNGCGTADVRPTAFVNRFNEAGISTVIATHTEVSGKVAGEFLDCFADAVGDAREHESVSDAYRKALVCLSGRSDQNDEPIGDRALTYTLLGDGRVPLCPPLKKEVHDAGATPSNPAVPLLD